MKIAVTGGMGYIGSRLVDRLIAKGHDVLIIDTAAAVAKSARTDCAVASADITNPEDLKSICPKNVDVLLHLAAQSSGPRSFHIPDVDIKINILGTLNMINWCRENKIGRILFASSFVVYGDNPHTEILGEDAVCAPKSVYALSKYTCEQLLKIYATPHGIHWNVLRMFNVYGPGQDLTKTDQGIVSIFLSLVKNGNHVPVKGRLDRFRDLIHIEDVVQGWELCLNDRDHWDQTYNLGSGAKTTISTLIDTLIASFGKTGQVRVEEVGVTPGDIMGCYADIGKISRDLGYRPQYDLIRGIGSMVAWAKSL